MSKSKKPAEDKSKAGAVTNSIADEIDTLLDHLVIGERKDTDGNVKERVVEIWKDGEITEAKSALLTLIADREEKVRKEVEALYPDKSNYYSQEALDKIVADRERKARIGELEKQIELFKWGNGIDKLLDRISELQAEDKG